ncbi:hypothetical protein BKA66DRAFT_598731 [Pyrenochaeta sp. MPI-SDFR-AT-0127]|nr:hypothetical protein BKA66DRAFT_598731 [Pyrenochaeta sp. MPI-SDFR-AT-0127]
MVSLRFYSRYAIVGRLGTDDWAMLSALVTIPTLILFFLHTKNGLGRHIQSVSSRKLTEFMKVFYFSIVFYNASLLAIKISFILQYYRAFSIRRMRIALYVTLIIITCWGLSQVLMFVFTCQPISAFWDRTTTPDVRCIPNTPSWYINAAGNIATDIIIFVLPLPIIRG